MILIGQLSHGEGLLQWRNTLGDVDDIKWLPPVGYLKKQPLRLPVLMHHDKEWPVGEVAHLERSTRHGLLCVARIRDDLADLLDDGPWFLSPGALGRSIRERHCEQALLSEVSLTRHPAVCGTRPVVWSTHEGRPRQMNLHWDDCWDRGVERMRLQRYTRADHLDIHDCDELSRSDQDRTDPEQARRRTIEEMPAHRRELAALAGRRQTAAPPPKPATVHRRTTPPRPFMSVSLNMFEPWELEELWRAARVADRSIIDRVLEEREAAEFGCA